jgi:hypothetical protein
MRGNVVVLKTLPKSKKVFTEWDEAIFLAAFQVFENALIEEPNILSRFRYKCERDLALKLFVKTQKELDLKVKQARDLYKWWKAYKKKNMKDCAVEREKMHQLVEVFPVLWD